MVEAAAILCSQSILCVVYVVVCVSSDSIILAKVVVLALTWSGNAPLAFKN